MLHASFAAEIQSASPALALSLVGDPFYQSITAANAPSQSARLDVLRRYFEYSVRQSLRIGRWQFSSDASQGAAVWVLPCSNEVQRSEGSAKTAFLADLLGPQGSANYFAIINFMAPLAEHHVPPDAWYLSILGVHPLAQGKGIGQALLTPTLQEASRLKAVCYLETFEPRNIAFYARLHFAPVATYFEPTTGCRYSILRKEP